jgi:hypothetical protein
MLSHSLFGHLTNRFSTHPENLATEALCFILNRSLVARQAFRQFVAEVGLALPTNLRWQTQSIGEAGEIPDLVGVDEEHQKRIVVEAKFWAGLTDHQPVSYLKSLPMSQTGVLLFIAPDARLTTLWPILQRRCQEAQIAQSRETLSARLPPQLRVLSINEHHCLALTSWSAVLNYLLVKVETAGETDVAGDIQQLLGLCASQDTEAFRPLQSEELTSDTGRRILQYCALVDDVTKQLALTGKVSTKGLGTSTGAGYYGRYLRIKKFGALLMFSSYFWTHLGDAPLCLRLYDIVTEEWLIDAEKSRKALASLEMESPPRLQIVDDAVIVPLHLPLGVERDEVVRDMVAQIQSVISLLSTRPELKSS